MILDSLAEASRKRVEENKRKLSLHELKTQIYWGDEIRSFHSRDAFAFERALKKLSFICEVKKASPSMGVIVPQFPYLEIAKQYEEAGAAAISVLTEPEYFQGDNQYLSEISAQVGVPVLRKDFTVDEYQIYEAKVIGADAVLLICSLLDTERIKDYLAICEELGLSALVEAHTLEEIHSAIEAGARVIGVNNRNLKTFEVDIRHCIQLRSYVPDHITFVAESGIKTEEEIKRLHQAGVDAVLIGEALMRSTDKKKALAKLRCMI